ncbi:hypothetical protein Tco_1548637 [Tanacetum coccineum]
MPSSSWGISSTFSSFLFQSRIQHMFSQAGLPQYYIVWGWCAVIIRIFIDVLRANLLPEGILQGQFFPRSFANSPDKNHQIRSRFSWSPALTFSREWLVRRIICHNWGKEIGVFIPGSVAVAVIFRSSSIGFVSDSKAVFYISLDILSRNLMKVPSPFRKSFPGLFRPSRSSLLAAGKVSRWWTSRDLIRKGIDVGCLVDFRWYSQGRMPLRPFELSSNVHISIDRLTAHYWPNNALANSGDLTESMNDEIFITQELL